MNTKITIMMMLAVLLSGCVGTKAGAYQVFAEDLERLSGKNFTDSYIYNIGYLDNLVPENIESLNNGNTIKAFSIKPPRKQQCTVYVEIDSDNIIVDAISEGSGCWRAY
ncbi:hypothetical protein ACWJJH_02990 [Endozoicomonadaceae bacterium StTr2]